MAYSYYQVSLKGLPKTVLRAQGRSKILHLRIPTVTGKVEVKFKNGDIVRTQDWKAKAALEHYRVPRINIFSKPKGKTVFKHAYHDHKEYGDIIVFTEIDETDNFQHEIG